MSRKTVMPVICNVIVRHLGTVARASTKMAIARSATSRAASRIPRPLPDAIAFSRAAAMSARPRTVPARQTFVGNNRSSVLFPLVDAVFKLLIRDDRESNSRQQRFQPLHTRWRYARSSQHKHTQVVTKFRRIRHLFYQVYISIRECMAKPIDRHHLVILNAHGVMRRQFRLVKQVLKKLPGCRKIAFRRTVPPQELPTISNRRFSFIHAEDRK